MSSAIRRGDARGGGTRSPSTPRDVDIRPGTRHAWITAPEPRGERGEVLHARWSVAVKLERQNGAAEISITDEGIGIPSDDLTRLGGAFTRGVGKAATFAGMGIGLHVAKLVAEAHGGSVQLESPGEDKGTTVRVRLPLSRVPEEGRTYGLATQRILSPSRLPLRHSGVDVDSRVDEAVSTPPPQASDSRS